DGPAVETQGHGRGPSLIRERSGEDFPRGHLPEPGTLLTTCRNGFAVRAKGQRLDRARMDKGRRARLAGDRIPEPRGPVGAARQSGLPVRAKRHSTDHALMLKPPDGLARGRRPKLRSLIPVPRQNRLAVRAKGHGTNYPLMRQSPEELAA